MPIWRMPVVITSPVLPDPGVNIWHLRSVAEPEAADGQVAALSELVRLFYNTIKEIFNVATRVQFDGDVTRVDEGDPFLISGVPTWSLVGGNAVAPLPPQDCLVVAWRTQNPTKSGRGRTFLGPMTQASVEANGTPTEPHRTLVQGACSALVTGNDAFGNGAVGVWSPTQQIFRDFKSGSVANRFAILSSRRD
jgi:hypothetical protein